MTQEDQVEFTKFCKLCKKEYDKAVTKHPNFPKNIFHQLSILTEEAGEVSKAVNDYYENNNKDLTDIQNELFQTAAMCFRMYINLEKWDFKM